MSTASFLLRHRSVFELEVLAGLLVCQETVVLVVQDLISHLEGHGLEDPAYIWIVSSKERFLIS